MEMEKYLLIGLGLGFIGIITDILLKIVDYLYCVHRDLLITEPLSGKVSLKRYLLVYCMLLVIGLLLVIGNFLPLILLFYVLFSLLLAIVIITDYEQRLIFDRILVGIGIVALVSSGFSDISVVDRLLGAGIGSVIMFALAILMKGTLGFGDVKLVFVLGFWQGINSLETILLMGFVGGGLAALFLLITKIKKRTDYFAYGPYFVLGAFLVMLSKNL